MVNKALFSNKNTIKSTLVANEAGGMGYSREAKNLLATLAATGTFNNTYYANGSDSLDTIKNAVIALKNEPEFIAKVAVYTHEKGNMKDVPAFIVAMLNQLGETELFHKTFDRVITNGKMLRNVIQIARSGQLSRVHNMSSRSWRTAINRFFANHDANFLFRASIGNDPNMRDILRMGRPRPENDEKAALYAYFLGKDVEVNSLPEPIRSYELYKSDKTLPVPNVDFRQLDSLGLDNGAWKEIARNASWQTTRMNLNTFKRHGVFEDDELTKIIADRLASREAIARAKAFPYQLLVAYQNTVDVPHIVREALQDAMENAIDNVPDIEGNIVVAVDVSGSMGSPVTGYRGTASSTVRCVDVAALFGAAILRKNRNAIILPFDTRIHSEFSPNPRDTVLTNATRLAQYGGGGTDCSLAMRWVNDQKTNFDTVIYVSDNESWLDRQYYYRGTGLEVEWNKRKNPDAKLITIDMQSYATSQVQPRKNVLQVGGWSDEVFNVVASFVRHGNESNHWTSVIEGVQL